MLRARTVSIALLSLHVVAGCASNRPVEEEPEDPTDRFAAPAGAATPSEEPTIEGAPVAVAPSSLEAACPDGGAPLAVKLFVLRRHPTDAVPALPADGFVVAVDGQPVATGLRVGQVHTECVAPGEHEVAATGGKLTTSVRITAPGEANLAVAGGGGPMPDQAQPGSGVRP